MLREICTEPIRLLEQRGQSEDHPILPLVPETSYLKCLILSVSH